MWNRMSPPCRSAGRHHRRRFSGCGPTWWWRLGRSRHPLRSPAGLQEPLGQLQSRWSLRRLPAGLRRHRRWACVGYVRRGTGVYGCWSLSPRSTERWPCPPSRARRRTLLTWRRLCRLTRLPPSGPPAQRQARWLPTPLAAAGRAARPVRTALRLVARSCSARSTFRAPAQPVRLQRRSTLRAPAQLRRCSAHSARRASAQPVPLRRLSPPTAWELGGRRTFWAPWPWSWV